MRRCRRIQARPSENDFDVIVIGSGMGGMFAAAAIDPRIVRKLR